MGMLQGRQGFGLRPKMYRPSANTQNSRRKREKPLVPRVGRQWCGQVLRQFYKFRSTFKKIQLTFLRSVFKLKHFPNSNALS